MDEKGQNGQPQNEQSTDYEFDFGGDIPRPTDGEKGEVNGGWTASVRPQPPKRRKKGWTAIGIALALLATYFLGFFSYSMTLDKQMRSLIKTKEAIQDLYYDDVTDERFYGVLFNAINEDLLDDYSAYMNADEFAAFLADAEGLFSGLGLTFSTRDKDGNPQLLITRVSGNSPAEEAGVVEGSYVVGYGASEETLTYRQDYETFLQFVTQRKEGEEFLLALQKDGKEEKVSVATKSFTENYVFYRTNKTAYRFVGEDALTETEWNNPLSQLDDDTAYIRLTLFNGNAAKQFQLAMKRFLQEGKKNLVLDLRENGGGYMEILQEIASYFCKNATSKNPLVAKAKYKNGDEDKFYCVGNYYSSYFAQDSKIYLLADGNTASASECLIGCMLDYGTLGYGDICLSYRGDTAKTYGKGVMQTTYPLTLIGEMDAVKLTTAKIFWPTSDNCIHGRGILPEDNCLTVAENYQKDAEILAAISLFQNQNG